MILAKYRIKQNGIIYIIPNDELYHKYQNGEAFIDKYGRLINIKPHRVLKELEHIADDRPIVMIQPKEDHPIKDEIKEIVAVEISDLMRKGIDWAFDVGLPYLWDEKIKPGIKSYKEYKKNGRKLMIDQVIIDHNKQECATNTQLVAQPKPESKANTMMTEDEICEEQKKAVFYFIGLLESLTKLHNAGVIDKNSAIEQLTNPAAIEQFNQALSSNPNLLEMTKSNEISKLLGRDLFQGGEFVPIEVNEIIELATVNDQEDI